MKSLKKIYWKIKALLANIFSGFASRKLILIGVTGTDGKTTTTTLIYHILKQLGEKADYISTVGANVAGKSSDIGFHVTTPRFFALHHYFRQSVKKGAKYFVLEVTSHAIDQERIWGCHFKIGVLTNITNEHLDYHKSYLNYAKTKLRFINQAQMAVVSSETNTFYRYQKLITNPNVWYTSLHKKTDTPYSQLLKLGLRTDFVDFEKENVLLAFTVARILGFEAKKIVEAINSFERVIGRLDYFEKQGHHFLIDFAHTPNAYQQLYKSISTKRPGPKRIIHVFGCAGERDQYKRAKMGEIAAANADILVITEEDYRHEKIESINKMIEQGIKKNSRHIKNKTYFFINSRQEAIDFAVSQAKSGDLVLLTGKAHEKSLARGKHEYSWNEYDAITCALENLKKSNQ